MTQSDPIEVDATGLACPMPLLKAKRALNGMAPGERVRVLSTDAGSVRDMQVMSEKTGHRILESSEQDGVFSFLFEKA